MCHCRSRKTFYHKLSIHDHTVFISNSMLAGHDMQPYSYKHNKASLGVQLWQGFASFSFLFLFLEVSKVLGCHLRHHCCPWELQKFYSRLSKKPAVVCVEVIKGPCSMFYIWEFVHIIYAQLAWQLSVTTCSYDWLKSGLWFFSILWNCLHSMEVLPSTSQRLNMSVAFSTNNWRITFWCRNNASIKFCLPQKLCVK